MAALATAEGTGRFRERFAGKVAADHFRQTAGLWLSSIGIGTYLGEPSAEDDEGYRRSVIEAVKGGCNVIDTAINYRFQRSERSVGQAIAALAESGFSRNEIVLATKGGFIPFDGGVPDDPAGWFRSALMEPGIAAPDDLVANCHVMTPRYLEAQISWSLRNLGLESLDIYYLHNPEIQLQEVRRSDFLMRVKAAFELLESKVQDGVIGIYGVATWDGLRLPPDHPGHLSLSELLMLADQVAGPRHHFRAIQLPLNLIMGEACLAPTQIVEGKKTSLLDAAAAADLTVMASGSLLQGQVVGAIPPAFGDLVPGARTPAQQGLQIVRSAPGLSTALVGMKQPEHVKENMELAAIERMRPEEVRRILQACKGDQAR